MSDGDNAVRKFRQWLYHGKRPNWIASIANRATVILSGLGMAGKVTVTFEVVGRKSGKVITLPLVVAVVDGQRYLVSMLGEDVQWVLNVRAAGGKAAISGGSGKREEVQLEEVPVEGRAPILKEYLRVAPGARPHISVSMDSPLADFEKIAASMPVFHVTPS